MKSRRVIWLDSLFAYFPTIPGVVTASLVALGCYLATITPIALDGQFSHCTDLPLILGLIGIWASLVAARLLTPRYPCLLRRVGAIIDDRDRPLFRAMLRLHLQVLSQARPVFIATAALWFAAITALGMMLLTTPGGSVPPLFDFMPRQWYASDGLALRYVSVAIMGLPVIALVWTGGRGLWLHTVFMCRIARLQLLPSATLCMRRLRPLIAIGGQASLLWTALVGLFMVLFRDKATIDRIILLSCLSACGTAAFVIPGVALVASLRRVAARRTAQMEAAAIAMVRRLDTDSRHQEVVIELENQLEQARTVYPMVFGWKYIAWTFTAIVAPVLIARIHETIASHVP